MIFCLFGLGVVFEPIVVRPLEILKLDSTMIFVAEEFEDRQYQMLVVFFWQVELNQLKNRVQLVTLILSKHSVH